METTLKKNRFCCETDWTTICHTNIYSMQRSNPRYLAEKVNH